MVSANIQPVVVRPWVWQLVCWSSESHVTCVYYVGTNHALTLSCYTRRTNTSSERSGAHGCVHGKGTPCGNRSGQMVRSCTGRKGEGILPKTCCCIVYLSLWRLSPRRYVYTLVPRTIGPSDIQAPAFPMTPPPYSTALITRIIAVNRACAVERGCE